jgi:hypothetical protein
MLAAIPLALAGSKDGAMPELNSLAAHYLSHLFIARILSVILCLRSSDFNRLYLFMSFEPTRTFNPRTSTHPTPDRRRSSTVKELISQL